MSSSPIPFFYPNHQVYLFSYGYSIVWTALNFLFEIFFSYIRHLENRWFEWIHQNQVGLLLQIGVCKEVTCSGCFSGVANSAGTQPHDPPFESCLMASEECCIGCEGITRSWQDMLISSQRLVRDQDFSLQLFPLIKQSIHSSSLVLNHQFERNESSPETRGAL